MNCAKDQLPTQTMKSINSENRNNYTVSVPIKKIVLVSMFSLMGLTASWGQNSEATSQSIFNSPNLIYVLMTFTLVTLVLVVLVAWYALKIINVFVEAAEKEKATRLGIAHKPSPSWWSQIWQDANALIPLEDEKKIEMAHNFDGIRELDNHLPPWWTSLFVISVIWSVVYFFVYHVSDSFPLSTGEYENEVAMAEEQAIRYRASQPAAVIDENTLVFASDAAIIAKGKIIFESNCVACHRQDGGGNAIGPNLADKFWLHGGEIKNVFSTIKNGVVEKGMPAWGKAMSPQDVRDVSFFVMSIQGSNPKDAKAPQGEEFEMKAPVAPPDSIKTQAMLTQ